MRHRLTVAVLCVILLGACAFEGLSEQDGGFLAPADATSAIGADRFIELVNSAYAIYDRDGNVIEKGSTSALYGTGAAFISDPQIVWDAPSQRFYFAAVANKGTTRVPDWGLVYGFSMMSSPSSASQWCRYFVDANYVTALPDFPRLGLTADFALIGVNRFSNTVANNAASRDHPRRKATVSAASQFAGGDVTWIAKPGSGSLSSCPALGAHGIFKGLTTAAGFAATTPVPTREVDASSTGWIVANGDPLPATTIDIYAITNQEGAAALGPARSVSVSSYTDPSGPAPQAGGHPLDSGDSRLTSAWMAFDPRVGHTAIWLAHTVAGGAGAAVRWYELDPVAATVDQSGTVSDPSLHVYYPAISPDRSAGRFGSNMAIALTTSSSSQPTAAAIVQKTGALPTSPLMTAKASTQAWSCTIDAAIGACRWGDYLGASPDPSASGPNSGVIWLTGEWNSATLWRTWNWQAGF